MNAKATITMCIMMDISLYPHCAVAAPLHCSTSQHSSSSLFTTAQSSAGRGGRGAQRGCSDDKYIIIFNNNKTYIIIFNNNKYTIRVGGRRAQRGCSDNKLYCNIINYNRVLRLPQKFIHPMFFNYSSKICIIVQPIAILVQ